MIPTVLAATSNQTTNVLATQRIFSIDAFRGVTILVMIFVNELAGVAGLPDWTKHAGADANTMTYVDVVFPAFLFIVGMSVPFAIAGRLRKGDSPTQLWTHILIRTVALLVLGVFMVNAEGGYNEDAMLISIPLWSLLFFISSILVWNIYADVKKNVVVVLRALGVLGLITLAFLYRQTDGSTGLTPQWWGILGLIGWAYFFSCAVYVVAKGSIWALITFMVLAIGFYIIGKEFEASPNAILQFVSMQKGHATHTAIVLAGAILSLIVFDQIEKRPVTKRLISASIFGVSCLIGGLLLQSRYMVSKIYATPSWALFSAAICVAVYLLLFWLMDVGQKRRWAALLEPAAANPLLTYLIPFFIAAAFGLIDFQRPSVFGSGIAGVIWSAAFALTIMSVVIFLNRIKIKLQL